MELADVTDSKSVGSNTVRVRPPPPAPKEATPQRVWLLLVSVVWGILRSRTAGKQVLCDARSAKTARPVRRRFGTWGILRSRTCG